MLLLMMMMTMTTMMVIEQMRFYSHQINLFMDAPTPEKHKCC